MRHPIGSCFTTGTVSRSHMYLGYALRVRGNIGSEVREFLIGVGEGAHTKRHHWNPSKGRYRTETFCYGPRACPLYRSGPCARSPAVME